MVVPVLEHPWHSYRPCPSATCDLQVGCEPRHKRCPRCENPAPADSGSGNHFGRWQRYWRRGVYAMIWVGVRKKEIGAMRRWYLPLTVLGLASLGALILTQRGRQALAWLADNFDQADTLFDGRPPSANWNACGRRSINSPILSIPPAERFPSLITSLRRPRPSFQRHGRITLQPLVAAGAGQLRDLGDAEDLGMNLRADPSPRCSAACLETP